VRADLLILAADLIRREEPFVLATVVRRQPASSSQSGDMALVDVTGRFHGWLGGSCTQPTVVREALHALADGKPRLISLSPEPEAERRPGVLVFPMTCHSGGSVDIYIEPISPPARFLVFGLSPVSRAFARLAKAMGYAVDVADPEADRARFPEADRFWTDWKSPAPPLGSRPFAVVATMGESDEDAVQAALSTDPVYLGVVASGKRFAQIRDSLTARGIPAAALARIKSPAGLDIGAETPEEIAASIVAEIVQVRRREAREPAAPPAPATLPTAAAREEIDPVCGMTVDVASAKHRAEVGGRSWYFCCAGCREKFLAAPAKFGAAAGAGARG
jgi:xanthine dehydrogenase accessory factor